MGGTVHEVLSSLIYENTEPVFCNFVENFNDIREKGGYYKTFAKLMVNSLYGGMGRKDEELMHHIAKSYDEYELLKKNVNIHSVNKIENMYFCYIKCDLLSKSYFGMVKFLKSESNVSYSIAIASKARIKLYNAFNDVIQDGGRILYCDTDSIFAEYPKDDISSKTIGGLEWQNEFVDGFFVSPKVYGVKNMTFSEVKFKGVKFDSVGYEDLKDKFYNSSENFLKIEKQLHFSKREFSLRQYVIQKNINI